MEQTTATSRGTRSHPATTFSFYSRRAKRPTRLRDSWQTVQPRPAPARKKGKRNQQSLGTNAILETLVSLVKESHLRISQLEKRFDDSEAKSPSVKPGDVPSKAHARPCALAQAQEESKKLRLRLDQMESQTKVVEQNHDRLVSGLRKSLRRSRNEVAILEAREEGRQLGRKEFREEVLFNDVYSQVAPSPRPDVTSILSSPVEDPLPSSNASERTIKQTTKEQVEKTPAPPFNVTPYGSPAEETQRQLVSVQLDLQVAKQELEELQERTHEYKNIVQQPGTPGSTKGSEDTWEGDEEPHSKEDTNNPEPLDLPLQDHASQSTREMQRGMDELARKTSFVEKMNRERFAQDQKRAFDGANEMIRRRDEKSRRVAGPLVARPVIASPATLQNLPTATIAPADDWQTVVPVSPLPATQWMPTPESQYAAARITGRRGMSLDPDPWFPPGSIPNPGPLRGFIPTFTRTPSGSVSSISTGAPRGPRFVSPYDRPASTTSSTFPSTGDTSSSSRYPSVIPSSPVIHPHPSWVAPAPEDQTPLANTASSVATFCPCKYCRSTGTSRHINGIAAQLGPPVIL